MIQVNYTKMNIKYSSAITNIEEPLNKTIKIPTLELHINVSTIGTDLGGAYHEYLGVYLTKREYAIIIPTSTSFVEPVWLGNLSIDTVATDVVTVHTKEIYHEDVCLSRECKKV